MGCPLSKLISPLRVQNQSSSEQRSETDVSSNRQETNIAAEVTKDPTVDKNTAETGAVGKQNVAPSSGDPKTTAQDEGSAVKPILSLLERGETGDIKTTIELINAINLTESDEDLNHVTEWLQICVKWFANAETQDLFPEELQEYMLLGTVNVPGYQAREVQRRWFISLCNKLSKRSFNLTEMMQSMLYALDTVNPRMFEGDTSVHLQLAKMILENICQEAHKRYALPKQITLIHALHYCFALIQKIIIVPRDVASDASLDEMDDDNDISYLEYFELFETIEKQNQPYLFAYRMELVKQSLQKVKLGKILLRSYGMCQDTHLGLFGDKCVETFVQRIKTSTTVAEADKKTIDDKILKYKRNHTFRADWIECLKILNELFTLALIDPEKVKDYLEFFDILNSRKKGLMRKKHFKALRMEMLDTLVCLIRFGPKEGCELLKEELVKIGKCCCWEGQWSKDLDLYEAVLNALLAVHRKTSDESRFGQLLVELEATSNQGLRRRFSSWSNDIPMEQNLDKESNATTIKTRILLDMFLEGNVSDKHYSTNSLVQTSQTKEEQKARVQRMHNSLKNQYLSDDFALCSSFVDKSITSHVKDFEFSLQRIQESSDGSIEKTPILLQNIFDKRSTAPGEKPREVKKVLMVGQAGIGKTSIVKKLVFEWANNRWGKKFNAVYYIPVQELSASYYDDSSRFRRTTLSSAIATLYFRGRMKMNSQEFSDLIRKDCSTRTTLLIMDGMGEHENASSEIIWDIQSSKCKVLISSRPKFFYSEDSVIDLKVECKGLNNFQIKRLVMSQLGEDQAKSLIDFLLEEIELYEISNIPMNLLILCHLWKTQDEKYIEKITSGTSGSLTLLYKLIVDDIWKLFVIKAMLRSADRIKKDKIFKLLGNLAYKALERKKYFIYDRVLMELSPSRLINRVLVDCGILVLHEGKRQYMFPHLTFQEYFAALYLVHYLNVNNEERRELTEDLISYQKYDCIFVGTLEFVIDLVAMSTRKKSMERLLKVLNDQPKEALGVQHSLLMLKVLDKVARVEDLEEQQHSSICQLIQEESKFLLKALEFLTSSDIYQSHLVPILESLSQMPYVIEQTPKIVDLLIETYKIAQPIKDTKLFASIIKHSPDKISIFVDRVKERCDIKHLDIIIEVMELAPEYADCLESFIKDICKGDDLSKRCLAFSHIGSIIMRTLNRTKDLEQQLLHGSKDFDSNIRSTSYLQIAKLIKGNPNNVERNIDQLLARFQSHDKEVRIKAISQWNETMDMAPREKKAIFEMLLKTCNDDEVDVREAIYAQLGNMIEVVPEKIDDVLKLLFVACSDHEESIRRQAYHQMRIALELIIDWNDVKTLECSFEKNNKIDDASNKEYEEMECNANIVTNRKNAIIKQFLYGCQDKDDKVQKVVYNELGQVMVNDPDRMETIIKQTLASCYDDNNEDPNAKYRLLKEQIDQATKQDYSKTSQSQSNDKSNDKSESEKPTTSQLTKVQENEQDQAPDIEKLLMAGCLDENTNVRKIVYQQLSQMLEMELDFKDEIINQLLEAPTDPDVNIRKLVYSLFKNIVEKDPSKTKRVIQYLLDKCKDDDREVHEVVYEQLGKMLFIPSDELERIVQQLFIGCKHEIANVRKIAYQQLIKIDDEGLDEAQQVSTLLLDGCHDKDKDVVCMVYKQIGELIATDHDDNDSLVDQLIDACKEQDLDIRKIIYQQFGKIIEQVPQHEDAILEVLLDDYRNNDKEFRKILYEQLGQVAMKRPNQWSKIKSLYFRDCEDDDWSIRTLIYEQYGKVIDTRSNSKKSDKKESDNIYESEVKANYDQISNAMDIIPNTKETIITHMLKGCANDNEDIREYSYKRLGIAHGSTYRRKEEIRDQLLKGCQDCSFKVRLAVKESCLQILQHDSASSSLSSSELFSSIVNLAHENLKNSQNVSNKFSCPSEIFKMVMDFKLELLFTYYAKTEDARLFPFIVPKLLTMPVVVNEYDEWRSWNVGVRGVTNENFRLSASNLKSFSDAIEKFKDKITKHKQS